MRRAEISAHGVPAAQLDELTRNKSFRLTYRRDYEGPPVSLALPVRTEPYDFEEFPPFLDGLLLEGVQLEALLRQAKLDADDYLGQLITVGNDLVGALTVSAIDQAYEA